MKVLFQARINLFTAPGGDTIQIVKTMDHLKNLGITCDLNITITKKIDYSKYDLVHLFNFTRIQETYWFAKQAKRAGKPVLLSTIYWDNTEVEKLSDIGFRSFLNKYLSMNQIEYLKGLARFLIQKEINRATLNLLLKGFRRLQLDTIQYIDFYLPNAEIEMEMFNHHFAKDRKLPYLDIPNGVELTDKTESINTSTYKELKNCVLCVGRIDPRKNQLNLVRALKNTDLTLVFVGKPAPNHQAYMKKIEKEIRPGMHFLGQLEHEKIIELYQIAKVHVCPSWYETPGLVSLEAASLGCNIVVTDLGSTREYFGHHAFYCKPDSLISIHDQVLKAYESPKDRTLKEIVDKNFTWKRAAEKTAEAYEILKNQKIDK